MPAIHILIRDMASQICSMLFEQGVGLAVPERIPFRLTHNMVDAMGVTGTEGVYRQACESTMAILRGNRDLLVAVRVLSFAWE
jgi:phosphatidylinositol kinase/protein kinase (PI-3  family)